MLTSQEIYVDYDVYVQVAQRCMKEVSEGKKWFLNGCDMVYDIITKGLINDKDYSHLKLLSATEIKALNPKNLLNYFWSVIDGIPVEPEHNCQGSFHLSSVVKCNLNEYLAKKGLTPRQIEVVGLLMFNLKQREMADALSVDIKTVKFHLTYVYKKFAVNGKEQLLSLLKEYIEGEKHDVTLNDNVDIVEVRVDCQGQATTILPHGVLNESRATELRNVQHRTQFGY